MSKKPAFWLLARRSDGLDPALIEARVAALAAAVGRALQRHPPSAA